MQIFLIMIWIYSFFFVYLQRNFFKGLSNPREIIRR